jgi:tetratricopeptide (TPR) repeat protein
LRPAGPQQNANLFLRQPLALDEPPGIEIDAKPRTQVFLAEALCGMGRCAEAEQVLKQVISIDPAFSFAYRRLGYVYLELKRYSEALVMFRQFMNSPQGENASEVKTLMLQLEQRLK